jgi:hypothetical protein
MTEAELIQEIGDRMSEISDECYFAGWLDGLEKDLPDLCEEAVATNEPVEYGIGLIAPAEAAELLALVKRLGCWVTFGDGIFGYKKVEEK